jgi:hypothetical protein
MNAETDQVLLRIEQLTLGILRAAVSGKLAEIRSDKTLKLIYELTGNLSVVGIAKKARVSTGKVSGVWQGWEDAGLIVKEGKSYRKLV